MVTACNSSHTGGIRNVCHQHKSIFPVFPLRAFHVKLALCVVVLGSAHCARFQRDSSSKLARTSNEI